jgi:hypothetical protein
MEADCARAGGRNSPRQLSRQGVHYTAETGITSAFQTGTIMKRHHFSHTTILKRYHFSHMLLRYEYGWIYLIQNLEFRAFLLAIEPVVLEFDPCCHLNMM